MERTQTTLWNMKSQESWEPKSHKKLYIRRRKLHEKGDVYLCSFTCISTRESIKEELCCSNLWTYNSWCMDFPYVMRYTLVNNNWISLMVDFSHVTDICCYWFHVCLQFINIRIHFTNPSLNFLDKFLFKCMVITLFTNHANEIILAFS